MSDHPKPSQWAVVAGGLCFILALGGFIVSMAAAMNIIITAVKGLIV